MEETLFDKIVAGKIPSYKIWESATHMAFLTPFANTPGMTVVIPKQNPGDYVFAVTDEAYSGIMQAARTVSRTLEKALGVSRVAMVFEGTGVPHLHAKLYPLHGDLGGKTGVWSSHQEFYPEYVGYITTVEGPKMPDGELKELQAKILGVKE